MKNVINALQYRHKGSGISICLKELFGPFTYYSSDPCTVIVPKGSPVFPCSDKTEYVEAPCSYNDGIYRVLYQSLVLGLKYCRNSVLLTVDSKIPLLLPGNCIVVPLITDLAVFRMRETYQLSRVLLWRMQYRLLCRRAKHFLTISEFTRDEMVSILGLSADQIEVIYCASPDTMRPVTDPQALNKIRERYKLPDHCLLFVGNFNPRKNLERLIRAFDNMKQQTDLPHVLIIAGGQGWKFNEDDALRNIVSKDSIRFIGYVPDEDMPALYSYAELFVFPTLYEGFGMPVIEAQQCGTPVLTSDLSALPEVGGDGAYYVDPYDEESIRKGMTDLLCNKSLQEDLIQKGLRNAGRFSWGSSAQKLADYIENLV